MPPCRYVLNSRSRPGTRKKDKESNSSSFIQYLSEDFFDIYKQITFIKYMCQNHLNFHVNLGDFFMADSLTSGES